MELDEEDYELLEDNQVTGFKRKEKKNALIGLKSVFAASTSSRLAPGSRRRCISSSVRLSVCLSVDCEREIPSITTGAFLKPGVLVVDI